MATECWRIISGSPTDEEVAAVAVALAGVLATNATRAVEPADTGTGPRGGALDTLLGQARDGHLMGRRPAAGLARRGLIPPAGRGRKPGANERNTVSSEPIPGG
ncbi:acyl-CoA carboxylase epsilon subunit [Streptomyces sp. NPDC001588]